MARAFLCFSNHPPHRVVVVQLDSAFVIEQLFPSDLPQNIDSSTCKGYSVIDCSIDHMQHITQAGGLQGGPHTTGVLRSR